MFHDTGKLNLKLYFAYSVIIAYECIFQKLRTNIVIQVCTFLSVLRIKCIIKISKTFITICRYSKVNVEL